MPNPLTNKVNPCQVKTVLKSLPAGLAKMPLTPFIIYTTAGALLWVTVLAMLGFVIGDNQEAIESYLREITIATMVLIGVGTFIYIKIKDRKTN